MYTYYKIKKILNFLTSVNVKHGSSIVLLYFSCYFYLPNQYTSYIYFMPFGISYLYLYKILMQQILIIFISILQMQFTCYCYIISQIFKNQHITQGCPQFSFGLNPKPTLSCWVVEGETCCLTLVTMGLVGLGQGRWGWIRQVFSGLKEKNEPRHGEIKP